MPGQPWEYGPHLSGLFMAGCSPRAPSLSSGKKSSCAPLVCPGGMSSRAPSVYRGTRSVTGAPPRACGGLWVQIISDPEIHGGSFPLASLLFPHLLSSYPLSGLAHIYVFHQSLSLHPYCISS